MKNVLLYASFVLFGALLISATTTEHSLPVNTSASKVHWTGYKVTGQHSGTINIKSGAMNIHSGVLQGGSFTMDMSSIAVTDLEGEYQQKLQGHLSSEDFFGVEKHPTAHFEITKVSSRGTPGDYKVTGNLTIKNITKEIRFLTHVEKADAGYSATADIKIDRSDFDIRYGSGSFFDNLGDKTIYDEFDLKVELVVGK